MMLSIAVLEQGDAFITSCTLILTALIFYHGIVSILQQMASKPTKNQRKLTLLRRQLTPIGKFALLSQTKRNPSIITFFIALANKDEGMDVEEFEQLWTKAMKKHDRFRFHVCEGDQCFEEAKKSLSEYTLGMPHPNPTQFKARLNSFMTSPIDVNDQPWEVSISSGAIGTSGAILNSNEVIEQGYNSETVALFRVHHVICDGVSLSAVVKDISDEADQLDGMMNDEVEKYKQHAKNVGPLHRLFGLVMYYVFGSIFALTLQLWNMLTSTNPFDEFTNDTKDMENNRSVAWKYLATIDDAKFLTKCISKNTKLNDLFVALLGSALERQYKDLKAKSDTSKMSKCPPSVNVVVPVSLRLYPWGAIGNKIGCFVTTIPFNPQKKRTNSLSRLHQISKTLSRIKHTPAPLISWLVTALISKLGLESIAKDAIVRANCHAAAVVSNVHGFPYQIHWNGRPIKMLCAFLPLPPKVPIGILATSYDGKLILSVEADARVVPDADRFLDYMLEEYEAIKDEISRKGGAADE